MKGYIDRGCGRYRGVTVKSTESAYTVFYRYKNVAVPIYTLPLDDIQWRHNWRMWIGKYTLGRLDMYDVYKERARTQVEQPSSPLIVKLWENSTAITRYRPYPRLSTRNLSSRITGLLNTIEYGSCWYCPEDLVELLHEIGATEARCDYGDDAPI